MGRSDSLATPFANKHPAAAQRRLQGIANGKTIARDKTADEGWHQNTVVPIQRAINTNGGRFDTKEYKPEEEWAENGRFVGANIRLTFAPHPFLLDTDVDTIGLIQTVKTTQQTESKPPVTWSPENKGELKLKMEPGEQNPGMGIDKRHKDSYNQGLLPVSPVYAEQAAYDPDSNKIKTKVSTLDSGREYFGKNWERSQPDTAAELVDRPRSPLIPDTRWKAEFEVAAAILDGALEGSYLGSVKWGWESDDKGKPVTNPNTITLLSHGTPTADFQAAGMRWNKVMKSLPPKEDVDIFRPFADEKIESKKDVERQIRLMPDFIEEAKAPLFGELPTEELITIYNKLKNEKLLHNEKQQSLELALVVRTLLSRWQSKEGMSLRQQIKEGSDLRKDLSQAAQAIEEKEAQNKLESAKRDVAELAEEWEKGKAEDYLIRGYVKGFKLDNISIEQVKSFLIEHRKDKPIRDEGNFLQKIQQCFEEKESAKQQTTSAAKVSTGNSELDDLLDSL